MNAKTSDFDFEALEDESVESICDSVEEMITLLEDMDAELHLNHYYINPFTKRVPRDIKYWHSVSKILLVEYEKRFSTPRAKNDE